jgi:hypothetical protein
MSIEDIGIALVRMEEPIRDTRDLLRAAHMAVGALNEEHDRSALKTLLEKATDEVEKTRSCWERALELKRYGDPEQKVVPKLVVEPA